MATSLQSCVVCKTSRGKFTCGCQCASATVHKQCMYNLALRAYERKTKLCETCRAPLSCLKAHHFSYAMRRALQARLAHTGIRFGRIGSVPVCFTRHGLHTLDNDKKRVQEEWQNAIDDELANAPEFAAKSLRNAKKRKVEFAFAGSKWD